jgi:hypothetical protein
MSPFVIVAILLNRPLLQWLRAGDYAEKSRIVNRYYADLYMASQTVEVPVGYDRSADQQFRMASSILHMTDKTVISLPCASYNSLSISLLSHQLSHSYLSFV